MSIAGEYGTWELATPLVSTSQPAGSLQQLCCGRVRSGWIKSGDRPSLLGSLGRYTHATLVCVCVCVGVAWLENTTLRSTRPSVRTQVIVELSGVATCAQGLRLLVRPANRMQCSRIDFLQFS